MRTLAEYITSGTRGGIGRDPDEEEMDLRLDKWLECWKHDNAHPARNYKEWLEYRKASRAGGADAATREDKPEETMQELTPPKSSSVRAAS